VSKARLKRRPRPKHEVTIQVIRVEEDGRVTFNVRTNSDRGALSERAQSTVLGPVAYVLEAGKALTVVIEKDWSD
jgi:hypothetical protein